MLALLEDELRGCEGLTEAKHVFISYVREDSAAADRIQNALESAGLVVWRDRDSLGPGDAWSLAIRRAIQEESLAFVVLLSTASAMKERSHQRPELLLAAEEYRLRPPDRNWLFSVRLDDCDIPEVELGGGRYLSDLQWTDVFGDRAEQEVIRLVMAVSRVVGPQVTVPVVADVVAAPHGSEGPDSRSLKRLLRQPNADIELEDFVGDMTAPLLDLLQDSAQFPVVFANGTTSAEATRSVSEMLHRYRDVLRPLQEAFVLGGTYARVDVDTVWSRAMEDIARATRRDIAGSSSYLLSGVRTFPLLWLATTMSIACASRSNYSPMRSALIDAQVEYQGHFEPVLSVINSREILGQAPAVGTAIATAEDRGLELDDAFVRDVELGKVPQRLTPLSDLLHKWLRSAFDHELRSEGRYTDVFDRASVLMDALSFDLQSQNSPQHYSPALPSFGSYTWRYRHQDDPIERVVLGELTPKSPLLEGGLFGGQFERASAAFTKLADQAARVRAQRW